jgi:hypothetical protein
MIARADSDICNMALLYAGVNVKIGSLAEASPEAQACNTSYAEIKRQILTEFRWPFSKKRKQLTPYAGNAYSAAVTYNLGDLVQLGNNVYRSLLAANLNNQPDLNSSAAWWAQVTRDGYAYVCPLPDDCLDPIGVWEKLTLSGQSSSPLFTFDKNQLNPNLRNPRSSGRPAFTLENANDGTDMFVLLTDVDTPILLYCGDIANPASFPTMFVETFAWHLAVPLAMGLRGDEKKAAECMKIGERKLAEAFVVAMRDEQEDEEPVSEFEASRGGLP